MIFVRRPTLPAGLSIVLAAGLAYANTFQVPFLFDDVGSIVDNPTIRQLWPPGAALSPPSEWGFTVSGRPVLNLSFALNYAVSGLEVWSYHALNLVVHALAGLALFGIVRRTLGRPPLATAWGSNAGALSLLIALLWTLHPLQTESVTYIVQRAESLMGLFFLLTLYAFVRAVDSPRPRTWFAVSFAACLLGAGTKEVAALAPVLVFLYDRTFVAGSFRAAWARRRGAHLVLAATWLPLAWLVAGTGGDRGGTMGFAAGESTLGYWLVQFEAVARYLGLAFWPHPLVFDYGKIAASGVVAALPWALPVLLLAGATLFALRHRPVAGFLGAWFFGLLAPTSIVPGALQMIVEHRMYLPLAALIAGAVCIAARWLDRRAWLTCGVAATLGAGMVTFQRNDLYRDEERLWQDTIAKRPLNARAHNNLGGVYLQQGRFADAIDRHRESLRLDPRVAQTHFNLGLALAGAGRVAEAVEPFTTATRILPYYFQAHLNLGAVLTQLDRAEEALPHFELALRYYPAPAEAHFQFGVALARLGRWREAILHYEECARLEPARAGAHSNRGVALSALRDFPAAVESFQAALRLDPQLPEAHFNLALALGALGRSGEALHHYGEAVRLRPDYVEALINLGIALAQAGRLPAAIDALERAVRVRPDSAQARTNLGRALGEAGRTAESLAHYEAALRLRPGDPQAHYNIGYALLAGGRTEEARRHFERALELQPGFEAARDMLVRLQNGQ